MEAVIMRVIITTQLAYEDTLIIYTFLYIFIYHKGEPMNSSRLTIYFNNILFEKYSKQTSLGGEATNKYVITHHF